MSDFWGFEPISAGLADYYNAMSNAFEEILDEHRCHSVMFAHSPNEVATVLGRGD
jgi:hypothetical protein